MQLAEKVANSLPTSFLEAFQGEFWGVLRWHQLDDVWQAVLDDQDKQWFIYSVGEEPPTQTVSPLQLSTFIKEVDQLLRQEHQEDYCGIVYADQLATPSFIKIFDPNNLGTMCGANKAPVLPSWILSTIPPSDLPNAVAPPKNRQRWWSSLF